MTPTQRTIRALRNEGVKCGIVEKWNSHVGIRQDLFGIIDIIALNPLTGVVGIQACGNSFAAHWRKLTEEKAQETADWLQTPGTRLEIWAWRKVKRKRGGKQMIWRPRIEEITLEHVGINSHTGIADPG